jgi:quercetin dioxygenase-like cupin family protein
MKIVSVLCCLAVTFLFAAMPAFAQDPVKAAPQTFKERLNNDHVRVLEYTSKPGQKDVMHSHPDMVLYVIKGGTLRSTGPDGTSKDIIYKTGDVMWREAIAHSGENIGKTEMKALLIETKPMTKK